MAAINDPFGLGSIDPSSPLGLVLMQTAANRVNQKTPFGDLTFSGPGRNTAELSVTPDMAALIKARTAAAQSAVGSLDFGNFDAARKAAEEASFAKSAANIREFYDPMAQDVERKYTAQGLYPGGEGFDRIWENQIANPMNRALSTANLDSIQAGIAEFAALQGANTQRAGVANTLASTAIPGTQPRDFFAPANVDILGAENIRLQESLAAQNAAIRQDERASLEQMARRQGITGIATALIAAANPLGSLGKVFGYDSTSAMFGAIAAKGKDAVTGLAELITGKTGVGGAESLQAAKELADGLNPLNFDPSTSPGGNILNFDPKLMNFSPSAAPAGVAQDMVFNPATGTFEPFGTPGPGSNIEAAFMADVPAEIIPPGIAAQLPGAYNAAAAEASYMAGLEGLQTASAGAETAAAGGFVGAGEAGLSLLPAAGGGLPLAAAALPFFPFLINAFRNTKATPYEMGVGNFSSELGKALGGGPLPSRQGNVAPDWNAEVLRISVPEYTKLTDDWSRMSPPLVAPTFWEAVATQPPDVQARIRQGAAWWAGASPLPTQGTE